MSFMSGPPRPATMVSSANTMEKSFMSGPQRPATMVSSANTMEGPIEDMDDVLRAQTTLPDLIKKEAEIEVFRKFAYKMRRCLMKEGVVFPQCKIWIEELDDQLGEKKTEIFISFVGDSGSGKSYAINCILRCELLPSATGRATTAVVTLIKYHADEIYKASVKFISKDRVTEIIKTLQEEIAENESSVPDPDDPTPLMDPDSVEYCLFKALFRDYGAKELKENKVDFFCEALGKRYPLGSEKIIQHARIKSFKNLIQPYIGSNLHWAAIETVTIHGKFDSKFLQYGGVMIDMPGPMDQNEARAKVAENYKGRIDGTISFNPFVRAIDNKTGRSTLDKELRTSKCLEGVNRFTFIYAMTKCDEGAEDNTHYMEEHEDCASGIDPAVMQRRYDLGEEIRQKEEEKSICKAASDTENEEWKQNKKDQDAEKLRLGQQSGSAEVDRKRKKPHDDTDELSKPIKSEGVKSRLQELTDIRNDMKKQRAVRRSELKKLEDDLTVLQAKNEKNENILSAYLLRHRNSKAKQDFREDIADRYIRMREDLRDNYQGEAASYDKEETLKAVRKLPVVCISAKAYNRLEANPGIPIAGFKDFADTEIPQLKAEMMLMAAGIRADRTVSKSERLKLFCNEADQWSKDTSSQLSISSEDKAKMSQQSNKLLEPCKNKIGTRVTNLMSELEVMLRDGLIAASKRAVKPCAKQAAKLIPTWDLGRYGFGPYGACAKRHGDYITRRWDFHRNGELADIFVSMVGDGLITYFQNFLPAMLSPLAAKVAELLEQFGMERDIKVERDCPALAGTHISFQKELPLHENELKDSVQDVLQYAQHKADKIREQISLDIKEEMERGYEAVMEVKRIGGKGTFVRMKTAMQDFIDANGAKIYRRVSEKFNRALYELLNKLEDRLHNNFRKTFTKIQRQFESNLETATTVNAAGAQAETAMLIKEREDELAKLNTNTDAGDPELIRKSQATFFDLDFDSDEE